MNARLKHTLKRSWLYGALQTLRDWRWYRQGRRRGSFAQNGEDVFLLDYFGRQPGTYLDVGANHPFVISNTFLLYRHGWRGVTVEPQPALARLHRQWRPRDVSVNAGVDETYGKLKLFEFTPHALSTFNAQQARHLIQQGCTLMRTLDVEVLPLAEICRQQAAALPRLDLLSVDAEGMEMHVLRSHDFAAFCPRLLICERPTSPQERGEWEALVARYHFAPLKTIGFNTIFECRT